MSKIVEQYQDAAMDKLTVLARRLSQDLHEGQTYREKGDYFRYHICGVVNMVNTLAMNPDGSYPGDEEDIFISTKLTIVALLHDAVEDTDLTLDDLRALGFPEEIVIAIAYLTKTEDTIIDEYLVAIRDENPLALVVKKADMTFNMTNCIREGNLRRYSKYAAQMKVLLGADPEKVL